MMIFNNSLWILAGQLQFGAAMALVTVAVYHAAMYVRKPHETATLYFALLSVIGAVYLSGFFAAALPAYGDWSRAVVVLHRTAVDIALYTLALLTVACIRLFLRRQEPLLLTVFSILCTAVPVGLVVAAVFYSPLQQLHTLRLSFLLPLLLYAGYMLVDSVVRRETGALTLLFGVLLWATAGGFDFAAFRSPQFSQQLHGFGFYLMWLLFWIVLGRTTADQRNQFLGYANNSDTQVDLRTRELQAANATLHETITKLRAAEDACSQDIRMAIRLQQNYYPQYAPQHSPWQTGLVFQPAAGVAGNMYDFYIANNELRGASLFDVSRHDAVGGLTAVLTKAIVAGSFQKQLKLPAIMRDINDQLIHEIGRRETFVTGVLLRIAGNELECANAGHAEIVLREAADSNIRRIGGKKITGSILGLPDQPAKFPTVKLNLKRDDVVVAYSAGLTGTANEQGQQFGLQGIRESLRQAGGLTAQETADRLVGDLRRFIGPRQTMSRDLTVIVLRYMD